MNKKKNDLQQSCEPSLNQGELTLIFGGHEVDCLTSTSRARSSTKGASCTSFDERQYLCLKELAQLAKRVSTILKRIARDLRLLEDESYSQNLDLERIKRLLEEPTSTMRGQSILFADDWEETAVRPTNNVQACYDLIESSRRASEPCMTNLQQATADLTTSLSRFHCNEADTRSIQQTTKQIKAAASKFDRIALDLKKAFKTIRAEVRGLIENGSGTRVSPYLDVTVDTCQRTVRRMGYLGVADFSRLSQAWKMFTVLYEFAGAGISHQDLHDAVWPGEAVTPNAADQQKRKVDDLLAPLKLEIEADNGWRTLISHPPVP